MVTDLYYYVKSVNISLAIFWNKGILKAKFSMDMYSTLWGFNQANSEKKTKTTGILYKVNL